MNRIDTTTISIQHAPNEGNNTKSWPSVNFFYMTYNPYKRQASFASCSDPSIDIPPTILGSVLGQLKGLRLLKESCHLWGTIEYLNKTLLKDNNTNQRFSQAYRKTEGIVSKRDDSIRCISDTQLDGTSNAIIIVILNPITPSKNSRGLAYLAFKIGLRTPSFCTPETERTS